MRPPCDRALGGAVQIKHWYPAASPSQSNVAHRHAHAPRLDIDVTTRRCLHSGNDRLPREIAFEAAKLFRCDDDHFVTPMHRHVLQSFTADASHLFAKARLGILQEPVAGLPAVAYLAPGPRQPAPIYRLRQGHELCPRTRNSENMRMSPSTYAAARWSADIGAPHRF